MLQMCYSVANGKDIEVCLDGWQIGTVVGLEVVVWCFLTYLAIRGVRMGAHARRRRRQKVV